MNRLVQRLLLSVLLFTAILSDANAVTSIHLTATSGTLSADYSTLGAAFNKINDGTHQGAITITILFNTTESAAATLNATGSGSASYTSVSIGRPSGGSAATISGSVTGAGSALIVLNGATNVVIDGRVDGAGNNLTLRNTYSTATSTKPTILFTGGASDCTIEYCTVENNGTSPGAGVITFSTTGSNTNIAVENNNIGDATGGTTGSPYCGIYGADNTNNSNISIYNNNIYELYH